MPASSAIGSRPRGSACSTRNRARRRSRLPLSMALRLPNVPVTRVENLCATGTEALRGAAYAVAAGAVDIALAMGVEKLKDTGFARPARAHQGHVRGPLAARLHATRRVRAARSALRRAARSSTWTT